jgi:hypothetical protein
MLEFGVHRLAVACAGGGDLGLVPRLGSGVLALKGALAEVAGGREWPRLGCVTCCVGAHNILLWVSTPNNAPEAPRLSRNDEKCANMQHSGLGCGQAAHAV